MNMNRNIRPFERAMRNRIAKAKTSEDIRKARLTADSLMNHGNLSGDERKRLEALIVERDEKIKS